VDDLEFEDSLARLSIDPVAHDPRTISRRRFIGGTLAMAGAATVLPAWRWRDAEAASGLGANEGVLVVVFLGGGNDGLNTVVPLRGSHRAAYEGLRGGLAVPAAELLSIGGDFGLHPSLGGLHGLHGQGRLAVVHGVGLSEPDLSHFTATATTMQGGVASGGSGWLGRYLDGLPGWDGGMRGMAVSTRVPLHLVGTRAKVTAVPPTGDIWGADRSDPMEAALIDAVREMGGAPTGLGPWGDAVAANGGDAVAMAQQVDRLRQPDTGRTGLRRDLTLAARLINADLGARVVGVTLGGWDTHLNQAGAHAMLLGELDQAISDFYATLSPMFRGRVAMLVQSEFGRRPKVNVSNGTDHGRASVALVIGDRVRGGHHGAPPALDRLDERGNVAPTVDVRSVYAGLLSGWLGADDREVLGGSFEAPALFASAPAAG
jgi:uncharacterized protein (DUF1501 family)